jgi:hypothetical protein
MKDHNTRARARSQTSQSHSQSQPQTSNPIQDSRRRNRRPPTRLPVCNGARIGAQDTAAEGRGIVQDRDDQMEMDELASEANPVRLPKQTQTPATVRGNAAQPRPSRRMPSPKPPRRERMYSVEQELVHVPVTGQKSRRDRPGAVMVKGNSERGAGSESSSGRQDTALRLAPSRHRRGSSSRPRLDSSSNSPSRSPIGSRKPSRRKSPSPSVSPCASASARAADTSASEHHRNDRCHAQIDDDDNSNTGTSNVSKDIPPAYVDVANPFLC